MEWRKRSPRTPSAWASGSEAQPATQVDQFESVLNRHGETALEELRRLDAERSVCVQRIADSRRLNRAEEERLAEDEHLHLSKRRDLLLQRIWFIREEHKQARLLRAILEDQSAKREIINARRQGALEGTLADPVHLDAELDTRRRSLDERLRDVLPATANPPPSSVSTAELAENRRAIDAALQRVEAHPQ